MKFVSRRPTLFALFCLLLLLLALAPSTINPTAQAAPSTPLDTPVAAMRDSSFGAWTLKDGMFYWGLGCLGGIEFRWPGFLRREPANGGVRRTLTTTTNDNCVTFQSLNADAAGVYYYSQDANHLEFRPSGAPLDPPTVVLTPTNGISNQSPIVPYGDFLYWFANNNTIQRAHRNGTGLETVASTSFGAADLVITTVLNSSTAYWADDTGIWSADLSCGSLPCAKTPVLAGTSHHLLYYSTGLFNGSWYSVENTANPARIRLHSCSLGGCTTTTPYSAPADWEIGNLATDGVNLFWTERISTAQVTDGKLRRMPLAGGTADEIAGNLTSLDFAIFVDNANVYFKNNEAKESVIYKLPLRATAIQRDLKADAWEITQAVQNTANQAPLVANKPTYVRVYGRQLSGPNGAQVEAQLRGTRNGLPLPGSPLQPINGVHWLFPGAGYNRANLNDGWYFQLPYSWISGGPVSLRVDLDPRNFHVDPDRTNNALAVDLNFQPQPPACVVAMPVRTHTPRPSLGDPNVWDMINRFERLWPVPDVWVFLQPEPVEELEICWKWIFPYFCYGPYELEEGWSFGNGMPDKDKALASIGARAVFSDDPDACDDAGASVHYMGMVHPDANTGNLAGYANLIIDASFVKLPPQSPSPLANTWNVMWASHTMAQELTHNFNRGHVNCGDPDNVDNNYPYPPCQLDETGPDKFYGFDIASLKPIAPNIASDFMSYGPKSGQNPSWQGKWVSNYTWSAILNQFFANTGRQATAAQVAQLAGAANVALATGYIDTENGRGEINFVNVLPGNALQGSMRRKWEALAAAAWPGIEASQAISYHLRLLDAGGAVLSDQQVILQESDDHDSGGHYNLFMLTFPAPAGVVRKVELLADATVLDSLEFGSGVPVVTLLQPAANTVVNDKLTLQWRATDSDDDDLIYTVQYSYDNGAHWQALVTSVASSPIPTTTLTLTDLSMLHGSNGATSLVRVLASDGYNTGIGVSQPFQVSNRAPLVYITAPMVNQPVPANQPALLRGGAQDAEDGGLAPERLQWQVNGLNIGSGPDIEVVGLAPGAYPVLLTARDAMSNTAAATSTLTVAPFDVAEGVAPTLDGRCDDESYAAGVSVALAAYSDGAQATAYLLRSGDALWVCFANLEKGGADSNAFVGLRVDANYSRDALTQNNDVGFFVGEDGGAFTRSGDGAGGFGQPGPEGLQAQISTNANNASAWEAELRIPLNAIGGAGHSVGLTLEHSAATVAGAMPSAGANHWPFQAGATQPNTWATTTLGNTQPQIIVLAPYTATVGAPATMLTVDGFNFASGAVLWWHGTQLPTNFVNSTQLTATVAANLLTAAASVPLTVSNPLTTAVASNIVTFTVVNAVPVISSLSPMTMPAESPGFLLTVNGASFRNGAVILWNGKPLATTTFVNSGQLRAPVDAALITVGQTVGIVVRNPAPDSQTSATATLVIAPIQPPAPEKKLFVPLLMR